MKLLSSRFVLFCLLSGMSFGTFSMVQPMPGLPRNTHYGAMVYDGPVLTFAGQRTGSVLSVKKLTGPAVLVPVFEQGSHYARIEKFTVQLSSPAGTYTKTYQGAQLPADVLERITNAPAGSKLRFTDVVCLTGNGSSNLIEAEYTLAL